MRCPACGMAELVEDTKDQIFIYKGKKAIIPSLEITNLFNEKIIIILNHLSLLKEKNINLSKTRDLLLPRLITGKVDVSELDIQVEVKA
mgnify:CR=1 FL=1